MNRRRIELYVDTPVLWITDTDSTKSPAEFSETDRFDVGEKRLFILAFRFTGEIQLAQFVRRDAIAKRTVLDDSARLPRGVSHATFRLRGAGVDVRYRLVMNNPNSETAFLEILEWEDIS